MSFVQRTFVAKRVQHEAQVLFDEARESGDEDRIAAAKEYKRHVDQTLRLLWKVMDWNGIEFSSYDRKARRFYD